MEFLSFEDTTALYEATFFPRTYARFCHMMARDRPYVLEGKVDEDLGVFTLNVARVAPLGAPPARPASPGRRT
jgi:DNA polymerase III alpha subunit